jgi:hypothetical protein
VLSDEYWLVHSGDVKVYEDTSPPARARLVRGCVPVRSDAEALEVMEARDFDPSETLVLHVAGGTAGEICHDVERAASDATQEIAVLRYASDEIVVDVTTSEPGYLLLTDAWYPGWQARIASRAPQEATAETPTELDGTLSQVLRADILFRAVAVEPGDWRVTLRYRPRPFVWGVGLSLLGVVLLWGYVRALRRRS